MTSILFGVTSKHTALAFLDGHLRELVEAGAEVHLVCSPRNDSELMRMADENRAVLHPVRVSRQPRPLRDIRALLAVLRVVARVRPDVVSAGTPKMSLLLLFSAWLLRVPRRIYICHGLRHEGMEGATRRAQEIIERILTSLATETAAVSESVRDGLSQVGVPSNSITVVGHGSPDGVDADYFSPPTLLERSKMRARFHLPETMTTVGFIARLTKDKGIDVLLASVERLSHIQFLVAGRQEPAGIADQQILSQLQSKRNVRLLGRVDDVYAVYAACDLFILPSRREGLATVILEASAMGIPTVAMNATGTRDVVLDGETGRLVAQGDVEAFISAIQSLESDLGARARMGANARRFVVSRFEQSLVRRWWREYYLGPIETPVGKTSKDTPWGDSQ